MMIRDTELEAFPDAGLPLQEFARREWRLLWEARARTKKEVVDANARGSIASRLAGYDGPAKPRSSVILTEAADAAATALWDAVRDGMKGPGFIIRGIPKGEHNYVDIADALLDRARLINWSDGIIACPGGRRFQFVHVFQKAAAAGALEGPRRRIVRAEPMGERIAAALRKHGFELDRKGKGDADLVRLIEPEFPDKCTEQGLEALRKAVWRHFDRLANRPQNIVPIVRPRRR